MLGSVELIDALTKAEAVFQSVLRSIEDTKLLVREELYRDTMSVYQLAKAHARFTPELDETVSAFEDFLGRGKTGPREVTPIEEPIVPAAKEES